MPPGDGPVHGGGDSPRWCMFCQSWGGHHTDRCPVTPDRDEKLAAATAKTEAEWQRIQREHGHVR